MKKRVFSFFLVLVMIFSMVPTSAIASTIGTGTSESPYQIGDTVTNDGSAEPEGVTVENSVWVRSDISATQTIVCQSEEHDHETTDCEVAYETAECLLEGHPTEGEPTTFEHEEGTTCAYDAENAKWMTSVASGYACGIEAHTHTAEAGCIEITPAYTVWTLTEVQVENNALLLAEDSTYTVSFEAQDENSKVLRYVEIMIVDADDETVDYVTTNSYGRATYKLPAGTYTAIISYTSGNYSYYAAKSFTISNENVTVQLTVTEEYSTNAAQNIYNGTTYFNHVDIRVKGTYTTGSTVDLTTYNIKLANVHISVTNPSAYSRHDFDQTFTDNTETYEWRKTGVRVYKGASVTLTCDIYDSETGEVLKSGFTHTFTDDGSTDFVEAIAQCDAHQGLDFIIDPMEIIEAVFYSVRYDWDVVDAAGNDIGELPSGLATLPAAKNDAYEAGNKHIIDTNHKEGYYVIDEANGKLYTFEGWDWWSHKADDNLKKNVIGSDETTVTVTDDTVIYGVWVVSDLDLADSHITITKKFVGEDGAVMEAPSGYLMLLVGPRGGSMEIPLAQFSYDETTGIYSYQLPVYTKGEYSITEHEYAISGYDVAASVTVSESSDAIDSSHNHVTTGEGTATADSATFSLDLDYDTDSACAHVGEVDFVNTYTKIAGEELHNYPNLAVNKLDADDRSILQGATFGLYKNYENGAFSEQVATGTSDESGYLYFRNLEPGTYYLVETSAPDGYLRGFAIYRVNVTLKEGFPKEILSDGKWCQYYEYDMSVYYTLDHGANWYASQHFSLGTTTNRFRLAAFNEKVSGELTIKKTFNDDVDDDHYPDSITVTVTYPDGRTPTTHVLNRTNGWTVTLTGLELGTYSLSETIVQLPGYEFTGVTYNDGTSNKVTIDLEDLIENYDVSDPVAAEEVVLKNTYVKVTQTKHVYPSLTILKQRDSGDKVLSGATFKLYKDAARSELVAEGTTDANGSLVFQNLSAGTYYLQETAAPNGYAENSTIYTVSVTESSRSDETYVESSDAHITVIYYDVTIENDSFNADANRLTVKNTKDEGSLTIHKTFGVNNAYMPSEIKATVTGPNNYSNEITLSPANGWSMTLTDLELGEYTVSEPTTVTDVEGYPLYTSDSVKEVVVTLSSGVENDVDLSIGSAVLKNTYTREVINPASFQIKKVDKTGAVITSGAEFTLYSDESCTDVVQVENTGVDGIATFHGFTEEHTYYLKETAAPDGYELATTVWKVTVTLKNGEPTIKVNDTTNVWETIYDWIIGSVNPDSKWADGILTIENIKKTGKLTITKSVVDDEGHYSDAEYSFTLDASDDSFDQTFTLKHGEIKTIENIPWGTTYTLTEDTTGAAFTSDSGSGKIWATNTEITVANTYAYTTHNNGLNLVKVDADNSATVIQGAGFTLYSDEACKNKVVDEVFSDANGALKIVIANAGTYYLKETTTPAGYHPNKEVYVVKAEQKYVVKNAGTADAVTDIQMHITIEGLTGTSSNQIDYTYSIENTAIKAVVVTVEKLWDDGNYHARPDSVEVTLYRNNAAYETVTLNETNNWKYTWNNLTDEYSWSVDEVNVPEEYTKTVTNSGDNWTITNARTPKAVAITVAKAWNHNGGKNLPESINVTLYKDGTPYETVALSEENDWTHSWSDLTDVSVWSIDETEVPTGYDKKIEVDGYKFKITNTRIINPVEIHVNKVWVASEGVENPASVEVVLYRDSTKYDTVKLTEENNWTYSWTSLTDEYTWTVDEKEVPTGYTKNVEMKETVSEGKYTYDWTITNTKDFKYIDVSVQKVWYGTGVTHPSSVKVTLYRDGVAYDTVTLSASNSWKYTWEDLTDEFEWEVDEPSVPSGYNKAVRVYNTYSYYITNTYDDIPQTGDNSNLLGMGLMGMVGIIGFCFTAFLLFVPRKKGKYER